MTLPFLFAHTDCPTPALAALLDGALCRWKALSPPCHPATEAALAAAAVQLGADPDPRVPMANGVALTACETEAIRGLVAAGADPLGGAFCFVRSPAVRRALGATYTPSSIIQAMTSWAQRLGEPARVVDVGTGSGRFLLAAGEAFPMASLVGIEVDPLAALVARANLHLRGLNKRAKVLVEDYRRLELPPVEGPTLFIGNPPYVRHHAIPPEWKAWLSREAQRLGYRASQLAGLHVHFFLSTAAKASPGDYGIFITASEWLDVNYGALVRELLVKDLHAESVTIIDPSARPFPDAAATAVVTAFQVGRPSPFVTFRKVNRLDEVGKGTDGRPVPRERLAAEPRWSHLTAPAHTAPSGFVPLGDLCRVHRGTVTGNNKVWIAGEHSRRLPSSVLKATVTRAKEVLVANGTLQDAGLLRRVIDLPQDLDVLDEAERKEVERFLRDARRMGADEGYVARNRRAWWSVGLREPAPLISTYMARRPPAFALNGANARLLNIAHGLYPREPLSARALTTLREYLSAAVRMSEGRTYAGGLVKFEPKELERVMVPGPEMLSTGVVAVD